jgi:DNA-binding NarL/FixJ family response regulator
MKPIKIFIVDDNLLIRNGLKMELGKIPEIEVLGEAENGKVFLDSLIYDIPDIVFMDIHMPVMDGYNTTIETIKMHPSIKIIAFSMTCDKETLKMMINAGVNGYLLKNTGATEIKLCIENILQNKTYFSCDLSSSFSQSVLSNYSVKTKLPNFTNRETQILDLISKGYNTKQIAKALELSPRTVEVHIANMKSKTGSSNILNLFIYSIKNSIISI